MVRLSKSGALFAALYLMPAAFLFREALTCGTMLCDLVAFPVFVPAGLVYWLPFSKLGPLTYVPNPMSQWRFVIPTMVTNLVSYYFLGWGVGTVARKWFRPRA